MEEFFVKKMKVFIISILAMVFLKFPILEMKGEKWLKNIPKTPKRFYSTLFPHQKIWDIRMSVANICFWGC
jgi:hypothetical protein